jgi:hypothetical protein
VELLLEILNAMLMPMVLLVVGTVAFRAFLWLAAFSKRDASNQSRCWFWTGLKCVSVYIFFELNFLGRMFDWWQGLFSRFHEIPPELQMAVLMAIMFAPFLPLLFAYFLLPFQDWFFGLLRGHPLVVWKTRRKMVVGTFLAFVFSLVSIGVLNALSASEIARNCEAGGATSISCDLVLWALSVKGQIIFFLLAGALSIRLVGPSLRFEASHKSFRRWLLPAVWLYYWVTACIGWQYEWSGLFFFTLPTLLVAGIGFLLVVGRLLPFPELDLYRGKRTPRDAGTVPTFHEEIQDFIDLFRYSQNRGARREWFEQRRKALRCLLTYALGTNYPYYAVVDEKIRYRTEEERMWLTGEERLVQRAEGDRFGSFLSGPGIILTGCDHAVVISAGVEFKGAKGPGIVFTDYADEPMQAIDLRVQLRAFSVKAWTKDGIAVKVTTFIPFQIDTGKKRPALGEGFPYRLSAVFKAVQAQSMEHKGESQVPADISKLAWYDLPQLIGERVLRDVLSRYEFDELYAPFELYDDFGGHPRAQIAKALRDKLDEELPKFGIKRIGGGISNIEPVNEDVIERRVEAWRAEWMRGVMLQQAEGQSTRLRLVEQARAQAQTDIIMSIGKRIAQMRDVGEAARLDAILKYFIEVLEQLAGRKELRQLLPSDMDSIIQSLHGVASDVPAIEEKGKTIHASET